MAAALVQTVQDNGGGYVNSYTKSITPTAGNLLTLCIALGAADTITVTDSKSNTWQVAKSQILTSQKQAIILYAENVAGGATTITITAAASTYPDTALIIQEWSGVALSSSLDKTAGTNTSSGNNYSTGATAATTQASELVIGAIAIGGSSPAITGDGAFSGLTTQNGFDAYTNITNQYQIVSSTGTQTWTPTSASFYLTAQAIATFKAAVAAVSNSNFLGFF